jgi:hypothetical protein
LNQKRLLNVASSRYDNPTFQEMTQTDRKAHVN